MICRKVDFILCKFVIYSSPNHVFPPPQIFPLACTVAALSSTSISDERTEIGNMCGHGTVSETIGNIALIYFIEFLYCLGFLCVLFKSLKSIFKR